MRKVIRQIVKFVLLLLSRIEIIGKENIKDGNVVYVCNHQSIFDIAILFISLPQNTFFMAKKNCLSLSRLALCLKRLVFFRLTDQRQI